MKFDNFRKVGEDDHFAYMQHPNGHQIKVAKVALSPKQRAQLQKLPIHRAGGGDSQVPNQDLDPNSPAAPYNGPLAAPAQQPVTVNVAAAPARAPAPPPDGRPPAIWNYEPHSTTIPGKIGEYAGAYLVKPAVQAVKDTVGGYVDAGKSIYEGAKDVAGGVLQGAAPEAAAQYAAAQKAQEQAANAPPSAPKQVDLTQPGAAGTPGAASASQFQMPLRDPKMAVQGYDTQMRGIQGEANALGNMSQDQQKVYHSAAESYKNIETQMMQNVQQNEERVNAVIEQLKNANVDPEHYQKSRTSAQRTNMAIGLLLGGIGGGMTKTGRNPALEIFQDAIKQDIAAQKDNIGNKYNLLAQYQQQYGNRADALKAVTATYAQQYSNQIAEAAAKQGTPLAQARAQQAIGPLQTLKNQMLYDMSMRQAANQNFSTGNVSPADQVRFRAQIGEIPKDKEDEVMKAIDQVQGLQNMHDQVFKNFDQTNDSNTVWNRTKHGFSEPASVATMKNMLVVALKHALGRSPNDVEINEMFRFIPGPGDGDEKIQGKRQGLQDWFDTNAKPAVLDRYRIHVPTTPQFTKVK